MAGSVAVAVEQARLAADAGAWGYKVQLLHPRTIAREDAQKYWEDDIGTTTQREAFAKAGIVNPDSWKEVQRACEAYRIEFLATPFDLTSVLLMEQMGVRTYKIASGDITYRQLIEAVADVAETIILSTGASYMYEVTRAVEWCGAAQVIVLACNLAYPTFPDDANLARIETLRKHFERDGIGVGYSDHTSLPATGLAAAAMGAELCEVHYTLDNDAPDVPDNRIAVTPPVLAEYVEACNLGARLRGQRAVAPNESEQPALMGARRSITAKWDMDAGRIVVDRDLDYLRPGDGMPPYQAHHLVGKKLRKSVKAGEPILEWR